jgi:hypothetical protein
MCCATFIQKRIIKIPNSHDAFKFISLSSSEISSRSRGMFPQTTQLISVDSFIIEVRFSFQFRDKFSLTGCVSPDHSIK